MGFTDDRKYIWAGRLDDNKIFVFDVGTDPSKPKLVNTIVDFDKKTGFVGPHTFYALPGRMLVGALSNSKDHGGETGMAVYSNDWPIPFGASDADHRRRRRLRLRHWHQSGEERAADLQLYRLEQLHDGFRQPR